MSCRGLCQYLHLQSGGHCHREIQRHLQPTEVPRLADPVPRLPRHRCHLGGVTANHGALSSLQCAQVFLKEQRYQGTHVSPGLAQSASWADLVSGVQDAYKVITEYKTWELAFLFSVLLVRRAQLLSKPWCTNLTFICMIKKKHKWVLTTLEKTSEWYGYKMNGWNWSDLPPNLWEMILHVLVQFCYMFKLNQSFF